MNSHRFPAALLATAALTVGAEDPRPADIEIVRVLAPLSDDADDAANVQSATAEDIDEQQRLSLADHLEASLAGVFVNEAQGNPLQGDLQYRGFVASPLLGLPQGLAVYQDGVRINEPFGDTVNWALISDSAIDAVRLVPASNPLFGLNALGGAVAIRTKDGTTHPGTGLSFSAGSFGRREAALDTGGAVGDGALAYFATARALDEDGWRDYSPSHTRNVFAKASWSLLETDIDLSLTWADADLIGNGAAPVQLLELDRTAIFTRPDQTRNQLLQFGLAGRRELDNGLIVNGTAYLRGSDIATYNGDDSDFEECDDVEAVLCIEDDGEEEIATDANGNPIPAADSLIGATVNRTDTRQDGRGFGIQVARNTLLGDVAVTSVAGIAYDSSRIAFDASTELGMLDSSRRAVPGGVHVGDAFTKVDADLANLAAYAGARLEPLEGLSVTATVRYNAADIALRDGIGTALDGDHAFRRLNPGLALDYRLPPGATFYAAYSETNRAPSPVELTCADEDAPCRLPNAFLADPPLEQVVVRTAEFGLRGRSGNFDWRLGWFGADNIDDILFISAGRFTNEGYFDNVGRTRRSGFELTLKGMSAGRLRWFLNCTQMSATFEQAFAVPSENHPEATGGEIEVEAGARMPLVPKRLLNAGLTWHATPKLALGTGLRHASRHYLRGDEANLVRPIAGYTIIDLRAEYRLGDRTTLFVTAENVLDEDYATFGVFGEADDVLGDAFEDSRFVTPAAPRAAWVGIEVTL